MMGDSSARQQHGDALRQYYIAVDRQQFKMDTMLDLLELLARRSGIPLVICCSTRDSLDAVFAAAASRENFSAKFLHSDLGDDERSTTLDAFRGAIVQWIKQDKDKRERKEFNKLYLLVVTDACLPSHSFGEASLSARAVINYDLPVKKETYIRRLSACLNYPTSTGIVINMLVGGEVENLKNIEEGCGVVIDEMPINITELL